LKLSIVKYIFFTPPIFNNKGENGMANLSIRKSSKKEIGPSYMASNLKSVEEIFMPDD
jgi:hypothetical protein